MAYTIGACGFIGTASSSVSDFLKEFEENSTLDQFEFKLAYETDGLQDLKFHLNEGNMKYESGLVALKRFERLCNGYACREYMRATNGKFQRYVEEYLNAIIQVKWMGLGLNSVINPPKAVMERIYRKLGLFRKLYSLEKRKQKELNIFPMEENYFCVNPSGFEEESRKFVTRVLEAMGGETDKNIILDQPYAGNNPQASFPFFKNPKAIVVDRDPRDYYIHFASIIYYKGRRQMPISNVEDFVFCFKKMRENMPYLEDSPDILNIRFEDMIYEYESTTEKIKQFCEIKNHVTPQKYFDPSLSINNTQMYKRTTIFKKEIAYIEKMLPEYLYDFSKYENLNTPFSESFSVNPLNLQGKKWKRQSL